jgi:hypothetical protein
VRDSKTLTCQASFAEFPNQLILTANGARFKLPYGLGESLETEIIDHQHFRPWSNAANRRVPTTGAQWIRNALKVW